MINKIKYKKFMSHQQKPMVQEFQVTLPKYLKLLNSTTEKVEASIGENEKVQKRALKIIDILKLNEILVGEDSLSQDISMVLKLMKKAV